MHHWRRKNSSQTSPLPCRRSSMNKSSRNPSSWRLRTTIGLNLITTLLGLRATRIFAVLNRDSLKN
jgi:hypothetical protein